MWRRRVLGWEGLFVRPKGEIRFRISADHTRADIDEALAALRRMPE
jgi:hypothetical protein